MHRYYLVHPEMFITARDRPSESGNLELNPGVLCDWQRPIYLSCYLLNQCALTGT